MGDQRGKLKNLRKFNKCFFIPPKKLMRKRKIITLSSNIPMLIEKRATSNAVIIPNRYHFNDIF